MKKLLFLCLLYPFNAMATEPLSPRLSYTAARYSFYMYPGTNYGVSISVGNEEACKKLAIEYSIKSLNEKSRGFCIDGYSGEILFYIECKEGNCKTSQKME